MSGTGWDPNRDDAGGDTTSVRTEYDWSTTAPSSAIIETIAAVENVDPVALATDEETVLNEFVDPDALDTIITEQRANEVTMTLAVGGYTVRIVGNELVVQLAQTDAGGSE